MKNDIEVCKHEWHAINPFQRICCICNKVSNSEKLKFYENEIDSRFVIKEDDSKDE